jgi:23S rRNA pseudouridine2604 synthase
MGIPILDTMTKKCEVERLGKFDFKIILTQGLNRQIRRMCEYLGYEVTNLKRTRIMNVVLDIPTGEWRDLTSKELQTINSMVSESGKTEKPVKKKESVRRSDTQEKKENKRPFKHSGDTRDSSKNKS